MAAGIEPKPATCSLWGGVHDALERTSAGIELAVKSGDMGARTTEADAGS
jgi:hypothetical protein